MEKEAQKFDPTLIEDMLKKQNVPQDKIQQITQLLNDAQNGTTSPAKPEKPNDPTKPAENSPSFPGDSSPGKSQGKGPGISHGITDGGKGILAQMFGEPTVHLQPYDEPPALAEVAETEPKGTDEAYDVSEITTDFAKELGSQIGIDWEAVEFTPEQFQKGLLVEIEHGSWDAATNITNDSPEMTAKIVWAHLKEDPQYYDKLEKLGL